MAILINMGQRGFVIGKAYLGPGEEMELDNETAEKLSRMYGKELKLIKTESKAVEAQPEAPVQEVQEVEEVQESQADQAPAKRGRKKKVQE